MAIVRLSLVVSLVLNGAALAAQSPVSVSGRVVDQSGAPLPGVIVDLITGGVTRETQTDLAGAYRFDSVPRGPAEVSFRLINFAAVHRTAVIGDGPTVIDATMSLSLSADVVVTGTATFRNVGDVEDPAANLVGIASAASQGAITAAQLEARPIMRAGEVLEAVPGMIVSQHSGEGKANQYYLRGFNLDHGTDFATTIAGVPVNTPTGAHAHGYADATFLIPELVSGLQYKKGPYFADEGDFSAAGAANINYMSVLDRPMVSLSAGADSWGRVLAAASPKIGGGTLLAALELNHSDGPWVQPDDYEKINGVVRYSSGDNRNGFSLTGMSYQGSWNSTDQVPQRAIDQGVITRFGHLDETDGGEVGRHSVAGELQRSFGATSIRGTGYFLRNELTLFSNFTYFLDDPVDGDQFEQSEARSTVGGRFIVRHLNRWGNKHTESAAGVQVRRDWLSPVGLYHTSARRRIDTVREDEVGQTMTGVFGQTEIEWTRYLRTTFGLRADIYQFSVSSNHPENSGSGSKALASPKVAAVFGPFAATEFYANAGLGFHSNDARGAATTVDPTTGEPVERVTPLARARGAEVGLRTVRVRGLQSTLALWYLGLDSELLFVGDAGTTEASRPSKRYGFEWANYWRPLPWLIADADLSVSRARFTDEDPAGNAIPGALDRVISAGVTLHDRRGASGSLRVRHFGPRPLIEDASVMSPSTTLWNADLGYRFSPRLLLSVDVFNLFDAEVSDIDYFYPSRLQDEPADGIEDIHTHPALPRSARVTLKVSF
jgi:hypothetical protein